MENNVACAVFTFFSILTLGCSSTGHTRGFGVQLIHRDSPLSPFYNPNATAEDRWASMEEFSLNRLHYLQLMADAAVDQTDSIQVPIVPGTGLYLMKIGIGTPPVDTMAALDTGSNLIWIQCQPCTSCHKQVAPIFDPSKSTTFSKVFCPSDTCSGFPHSQCSSGQCNYRYGYIDTRFSTGEAASESFKVSVPEAGGDVTIPGILFGCAHNSSDDFPQDMPGVVGLGVKRLSFIGQLGQALDYKFSYCLVQRSDKESGSQMMFGEKAVLSGDPTPMAVPLQLASNYFLNLDGISVGANRLNIPPGTFRRKPDGTGGMIIDSGTPLTYLEKIGFDMLVSELKRVVPLNKTDSDWFCFYGTSQDLVDGKVPTLTFHFEGLDVPLSPLSTFLEYFPGIICSTFRPPRVNFSIFGSLFQQNLNVGYDLAEQKIYMALVDCATF